MNNFMCSCIYFCQYHECHDEFLSSTLGCKIVRISLGIAQDHKIQYICLASLSYKASLVISFLYLRRLDFLAGFEILSLLICFGQCFTPPQILSLLGNHKNVITYHMYMCPILNKNDPVQDCHIHQYTVRNHIEVVSQKCFSTTSQYCANYLVFLLYICYQKHGSIQELHAWHNYLLPLQNFLSYVLNVKHTLPVWISLPLLHVFVTLE